MIQRDWGLVFKNREFMSKYEIWIQGWKSQVEEAKENGANTVVYKWLGPATYGVEMTTKALPSFLWKRFHLIFITKRPQSKSFSSNEGLGYTSIVWGHVLFSYLLGALVHTH